MDLHVAELNRTWLLSPVLSVLALKWCVWKSVRCCTFPSPTNGCLGGWLVLWSFQIHGNTSRKFGFCQSSWILLLWNGNDFTCYLERVCDNGRLSNYFWHSTDLFLSKTSPAWLCCYSEMFSNSRLILFNFSKKRKCQCKCPFNSHSKNFITV